VGRSSTSRCSAKHRNPSGGKPSRLTIRRLSLSALNPAPYNPRVQLKPGDPEFESLRRSVDAFGVVEPLVWNSRTGHLVGGHQRLAVLRARGDTHADVSVVDLPPAREKALNLALNRIQGRWDEDRLAELLRELVELPEIELTGFGLDEAWGIVEGAMPEATETESFDIAAAVEAVEQRGAVTKSGDLIELGGKDGHRLLCGDCTDPATVRRLMHGQRAALFATDPPYLVNYDGTNHPGKSQSKRRTTSRPAHSQTRSNGGARRGVGGNKDWSGTYGVTWDDADANSDLYDRFVRVAVDEAIDPRAAWYCWHASKRQSLVERAWSSVGALAHCQIVWVKNRGVLTRTWYSWQHEPCLMGWLEGHKPRRVEKSVLSTVWEFPTIANGPERPDHPTPKPLPLFEIPMRQHTRPGGGGVPGDVCYEPFAGSGTQIIAAERLNRRCFATEISPVYCDVIVRRWIALVGPERAGSALVRKYATDAPRSSKAGRSRTSSRRSAA